MQTPRTVKEPVQCLPYSEEGCLQSFLHLENEEHLYFEKHAFEFPQNSNMSTVDKVKLKWAENSNVHVNTESKE